VSRSRVLLVDDSEAVLAFETAALSGHFSVRTALQGRDALAKVDIETPDLVVLDLSMPVMNGEEVLSHLTSDPRLRTIPVLIVSSESERARACLARGARAFLPKPIRADDLLATATRLVDEERAAKQRRFLACLPLKVGTMEMAIALDAIRCSRSISPPGWAWSMRRPSSSASSSCCGSKPSSSPFASTTCGTRKRFHPRTSFRESTWAARATASFATHSWA